MGFFNFLGPVLQTTALQPSLPLPSACIITTVINIPAVTSISNSTLTYTGPLLDGLFNPISLTTTTYTTVVTTTRLDGAIESQTYTIFGAPVEVSASSPSFSTPRANSLGNPITSTSLDSVPVPIPTTELQPPSSTSQVPQASTQAQALSTYIPLNPFMGCVSDSSSRGQPLLYGPTAERYTQESCKDFCTTASGGPYKYFGMKNGSDCHCGNSYLHPIIEYPGDCNSGCSGNSTQQCGGLLNRMSLWQNSDWPPKFGPPPNPGPVNPGAAPPFAYQPSFSGDGVDDDPWIAPPYPWRPEPGLPPPGVNSPPSDPGDGVDDGPSNAKHYSKHRPKPHSKQHSPRPNLSSVPQYRPKPEAPPPHIVSTPPSDGSSYNPYLSLAYPVDSE